MKYNFILLLVILLSTPLSGQKEKGLEILARAEAEYNIGEYETAEKQLNQANIAFGKLFNESEKQRLESLRTSCRELKSAVENYNLKQYSSCKAVFDKYSKKSHAPAFYYLGKIYENSPQFKNIEEAKRCYEKASGFGFKAAEPDAARLRSALAAQNPSPAPQQAEINNEKTEEKRLQQEKWAMMDDDGDGINNEDDACPKKKGPMRNNGCPVNRVQRSGGIKIEPVVGLVVPVNKMTDMASGKEYVILYSYTTDDDSFLELHYQFGLRLHYFNPTTMINFYIEGKYCKQKFTNFINSSGAGYDPVEEFSYNSVVVPAYFVFHSGSKKDYYSGFKPLFVLGGFYDYHYGFQYKNLQTGFTLNDENQILKDTYGLSAGLGTEIGSLRGNYMQLTLLYDWYFTNNFFNKDYSLNGVKVYENLETRFSNFSVNLAIRFW